MEIELVNRIHALDLVVSVLHPVSVLEHLVEGFVILDKDLNSFVNCEFRFLLQTLLKLVI